MRNISFSLTTQQFRDRTKTVTRRLGWATLGPGNILMACEKCQGLKRGQKIVKLGRIQVVAVRREPLCEMVNLPIYGAFECIAEGFPNMRPWDFVHMFCRSHSCTPETIITRIEFDYFDGLSMSAVDLTSDDRKG